MKSLDEVIKALECCCEVGLCESECPYHNDCGNDEEKADALHYLKEYRSEKVMWEADRKGYLDWIEQYKESREKHQQAVIKLKKNPALTWDELKQMVGKPVWVEYESYTPDWEVIENVGATRGAVGDFTGNFIETHMSILHKEDQGKTWQAYRKERR